MDTWVLVPSTPTESGWASDGFYQRNMAKTTLQLLRPAHEGPRASACLSENALSYHAVTRFQTHGDHSSEPGWQLPLYKSSSHPAQLQRWVRKPPDNPRPRSSLMEPQTSLSRDKPSLLCLAQIPHSPKSMDINVKLFMPLNLGQFVTQPQVSGTAE